MKITIELFVARDLVPNDSIALVVGSDEGIIRVKHDFGNAQNNTPIGLVKDLRLRRDPALETVKTDSATQERKPTRRRLVDQR